MASVSEINGKRCYREISDTPDFIPFSADSVSDDGECAVPSDTKKPRNTESEYFDYDEIDKPLAHKTQPHVRNKSNKSLKRRFREGCGLWLFGEEKTGKIVDTVLDFDKYDMKKVFRIRLNNLEEFPNVILASNYMRELIINGCKFSTLPDDISKHLPYLERIIITNTPIVRLPDTIGELKYLQEINITKSCIVEIPENIGMCKNLRTIRFLDACLRTLPASIGHLKNLKSLNLMKNRIVSVPKELGMIVGLEFLDLCDNDLEVLPAELSELKSLTIFMINNNKLRKLFDLSKLDKLTQFCARNNEIIELPTGLSKCASLRQLFLEHNNIKMLTHELDIVTSYMKIMVMNNPVFYGHRDNRWILSRLPEYVLIIGNDKPSS
jgi:hypothetical protein